MSEQQIPQDAPQVVEPVAPQVVEPVAPQVVEPVAPQVVDLVPPQVAPPVATVAVDPRRPARRRLALGSTALAALAAVLVLGATQAGSGSTATASSASSTDRQASWALHGPAGGTGRGLPGGGYGYGSAGSSPSGSSSGPSSGSSSNTAAVAADAAQQVGVVTIRSRLTYEGATAAGTGMVLSADGLVLTNNHVIDGATSIEVTVEPTGRTYTATVLGTDASADVALLRLQGATGLTPVTLDSDGGVTAGDTVTAVGNAEGTGTLVAAAGTVTATDQSMTAATSSFGGAESLSGLIELEADVVSGDSGGPVLEADGAVVGITTAASSGLSTTVAYAVSIRDAMAVVRQIESGVGTSTVTIGYPAFLGVSVAQVPTSAGVGIGAPRAGLGHSSASSSGATIAGVLAGTPAAAAGLVAGDTITAVGGAPVASGDELSAALAGFAPGDSVSVTWVSGTTGASSTATVTLIAGPAA